MRSGIPKRMAASVKVSTPNISLAKSWDTAKTGPVIGRRARVESMEPVPFTQSPFAVVTFIAAPALLTNASSVLAMSTINRMLRTRDRMRDLFAKSEAGGLSEAEAARLIEQVDRVEKQAVLLLRALRSIYVALGAFSGATLTTLLGAGLAHFQGAWLGALAALGLVLGFVGVGGLVFGSFNLFRATQISLINIREEAALIRKRQARPAPHPLNRNDAGKP